MVVTHPFKIITVITIIMKLINIFKSIFKRRKLSTNIEKQDNVIVQESNSNIEQNKTTQTINNSQIQESKQQLELKYENKIATDMTTVTVEQLKNQLNTIWDILKIKENTQAEHIIKSIPSDKWTTMDEIRHNIKLEFNIEYKNEKSLYPYLKTLTDVNLVKINNTGKKRTWKKNIIIINKDNLL